MTTSNTILFNLTTNQILTLALQQINVLGAHDIISASDTAFCLLHLNMMVKAWETIGIHLWTQEEACLFLNAGQFEYHIGTDHACLYEDFYTTTTTDTYASGTNIFNVVSTTGFTVGDPLGIVQDNNIIFWTTISAVNSSTQVTTVGSSTYTASSGAQVYNYTTTLARPLQIHSARKFDVKNNVEIKMQSLSRSDYFNLPVKNQTGEPINYFYDPQIGNGLFYIYQPTNILSYIIRLTATREIQTFVASTNTADFPSEWYDAIIMNLAVRVAPAYGKAKGPEFIQLFNVAQNLQQAAKGWDFEKRAITLEFD